VVLAAHAPVLLGLFHPNPLLTLSGVAQPGPQLAPGLPAVDPNSGFTAQADGHRAALDWLHGHLPWWNPYQGAGGPLAAATNSGALFVPFVLLTALSNGQVVEFAILNLVAAWATYVLLSHLGLRPWACFLGAVLFGLNGTNAWFHDVADNSVAFLPVMLLGIERARAAVAEGRGGGWRTLGLGVGFTLLAGFPEMAALDGLLTCGWLLVRLAQLPPGARRALATRSVAGVAVGVAISGPLLVAFIGFLPHASLGFHSSSTVGHESLPYQGLISLVSPYAFGPVVGFSAGSAAGTPLSALWANVGGYLTGAAVLLALVALAGHRDRALRWTLGGFAAVLLARNFGLPPARYLINLLPLASRSETFRYDSPAVEMCVAVLAAFAIDDALRRAISGRRMAAGLMATVGLGGAAIGVAAPVDAGLTGPHVHLWWSASLLVAALVVLVCAVGIVSGRAAGRAAAIAIVSFESIAMFTVPDLSTPQTATVDTAAIAFLRGHVDDGRFFSFGPFAPNYGAYFGIASADSNDVPVLQGYADYATGRLAPDGVAIVFNGVNQAPGNAGPSPLQELRGHLDGYRDLAVDYLVVPAGANLGPLPPGSVALAYHDPLMDIYRLAGAAPFVGASAGCRTRTLSRVRFQAACAAQGGVLLRREAMAPGWSASVDGHTVPVRGSADGFQLVDLPPGTSTVAFRYGPPHESVGWLLCLAGALALVGPTVHRRLTTADPERRLRAARA
jgi:hypothetical protein